MFDTIKKLFYKKKSIIYFLSAILTLLIIPNNVKAFTSSVDFTSYTYNGVVLPDVSSLPDLVGSQFYMLSYDNSSYRFYIHYGTYNGAFSTPSRSLVYQPIGECSENDFPNNSSSCANYYRGITFYSGQYTNYTGVYYCEYNFTSNSCGSWVADATNSSASYNIYSFPSSLDLLYVSKNIGVYQGDSGYLLHPTTLKKSFSAGFINNVSLNVGFVDLSFYQTSTNSYQLIGDFSNSSYFSNGLLIYEYGSVNVYKYNSNDVLVDSYLFDNSNFYFDSRSVLLTDLSGSYKYVLEVINDLGELAYSTDITYSESFDILPSGYKKVHFNCFDKCRIYISNFNINDTIFLASQSVNLVGANPLYAYQDLSSLFFNNIPINFLSSSGQYLNLRYTNYNNYSESFISYNLLNIDLPSDISNYYTYYIDFDFSLNSFYSKNDYNIIYFVVPESYFLDDVLLDKDNYSCDSIDSNNINFSSNDCYISYNNGVDTVNDYSVPNLSSIDQNNISSFSDIFTNSFLQFARHFVVIGTLFSTFLNTIPTPIMYFIYVSSGLLIITILIKIWMS